MRKNRLAAWDKQFIWHPFTQHAEWEKREPLLIKSGRGMWLHESQGRRYLDGNSSLWVNVWGHNHGELNRALKKQIDRIAHSTFLGLTHEPAIQLAKRLIALAPKGLTRVFYSDNGSTAVEVALKMAYQYWQLKGKKKKTRFVSLKEGYHGDTLGSVSVGGIDLFHQRFRRLLFKGWTVDPFNPKAASIDQILRQHHARTAAVVMEPLIQGASGMRVMPRGYLKEVETLCRRYGVLLIVDEVATGFGRTGTMFAVEQEKVHPDFLCVAKSLTGGYLPLAATLATEQVYRAFLGRYDEFKTFFHGHTYTANPLACAVAVANLDLYKKKNLLRHVQTRVVQWKDALQALAQHPHVRAVRSVGLMAGIELVKDKNRDRPYPSAQRMGLRVCDAALRHGLWLRPLGDVIVLMPPLAITKDELDFLLRGIAQSINDATHPYAFHP